ncbi:MAG TPA: phosphatidylserine decarboxylase family protein [Planctomycetaceae bacterium]|nr:phosphatidylserine decarboxylase family protein [Planctomycetaceae bacterium]HRA87228.1 phosphatidylserine decarboxylase family protein [Planctomycetaceae bacterium]
MSESSSFPIAPKGPSGSAVRRVQIDPREVWPMDSQLRDIQPGSGVVIHLEKAWGRVRRCWLKTFRRSYVRRMEACRKGDFNPCPHEVLDPRDLKFYRNQGGWYWDLKDDPFAWRDQLPFARVGLAELFLMCGTAAVAAGLSAWWASQSTGSIRVLAIVLAVTATVIGGLIAWFFRNPHRVVPPEAGLVVSPADGKIVDIEDIRHDDYIGGPAKKIGIFLSIFNVHINRAPVAGRVIGLRYRPGKCLNALRPESAQENERLTVMLEEHQAPYRGFIVRQITGAIARRIVNWLKPGDELGRGEQFGMIKLGSRTELVLPAEEGLEIRVRLGDNVIAGTTVLASYVNSSAQ